VVWCLGGVAESREVVVVLANKHNGKFLKEFLRNQRSRRLKCGGKCLSLFDGLGASYCGLVEMLGVRRRNYLLGGDR